MPKRIVPLSEIQVRNAKPQDKQTAMFDGGGLFLLITPSGGKLWRFKYRFGGKEKLLAFGAYPEISLVDARQRRENARKLLANGVDPGAAKKAQKDADTAETETLEVIAREWHARQLPVWTEGYAADTLARLEKDIFPFLGNMQMSVIKAPKVLEVLRRVEDRGAIETAHRLKIACGQIFRYAIATGRADYDPTAGLKGALSPRRKKHLAAITD